MSGREQFAVELRGTLAEADEEFGRTGDPMDALGWIALAAKAGAPLPSRMGQWLHTALQAYVNGDASMDEAMGLATRGQGQPRRKRRAASELNDTLGRMVPGAGRRNTQPGGRAGRDDHRPQRRAVDAQLRGELVHRAHRQPV